MFVGGLNYFDYNVIADNPMAGMDAYSDGGTMYFRRNVFRNNVQFGGSIYTAGGLTVGGAFSRGEQSLREQLGRPRSAV